MVDRNDFEKYVQRVRDGDPRAIDNAQDFLLTLGEPDVTTLREALASREGVYRIAAWRRSELDLKLDKLNRRADKLEQAHVTCEVLRTEVEIVTVPCTRCRWSAEPSCSECNNTLRVPTGTVKEWLHVRLVGLAPVVEGFVFLARIEHTGAGNILARAAQNPKHELPVPFKYRDAKSLCDHCQINRRRNDTFVLFELKQQKIEDIVIGDPETDDRYKQVGRNCLADFIRDPERVGEVVGIFALMYEISALSGGGDDDEEEFGRSGMGGGRYQGWDILHFLSATVSSIRQEGWVSSKQAYEEDGKTSTGRRASWISSPCFSRERREVEEWRRLQPTTWPKPCWFATGSSLSKSARRRTPV